MFLFTDTLVNIYCSFINTELTGNSTVTHTYSSSSNTWIFSVRYITAFLDLGTLESTSAIYLGAILNSETANTKYKNAKNVALKRL